jgi:hypothetical protein
MSEPIRISMTTRKNRLVGACVFRGGVAAALSGVYLLFLPSSGYQGVNNPGWDTMFLVSRTTWDMSHTRSGVVLIVTAVIHFAIH